MNPLLERRAPLASFRRRQTAPGGIDSVSSPWVLRWETSAPGEPELLPPLVQKQPRNAASFSVTPAGTRVWFEGFLVERGRTATDPSDADSLGIGLAYENGGHRALLDGLRGAFLLAIWDPGRRWLIVARDPMGLHPGYFTWQQPVFLLSSSVEALAARPEVDTRFHRAFIAEHLLDWRTSHQSGETFYLGIRRLPPAHFLILKEGRLEIFRYWTPLPVGFDWTSEDELSRFEPLFEQAVSRCLSAGADAIALSGGFDSVGIAALAADQLKGKPPLYALSLRYAGTDYDEGAIQVAVAKSLGMPQIIEDVDEAFDADAMAAGLEAWSRPTPGPLRNVCQSMYDHLFQAARRAGLRSVLFGSGGDDLLTLDVSYGADRLVAFDGKGLYDFLRCWQRTSPLHPARLALLVLWEGALLPELRGLGKGLLERWAPRTLERIQRVRRRRAAPDWLSRDADLLELLEARRRSSVPIERGPGERRYVQALRGILSSPLLVDELEQNYHWAAAEGFTLLYPFWDRDLVELSLRIHPKQLLTEGFVKSPLRRLVDRRLPQVVLRRKKVDYTKLGHTVIRSGGRKAWHRLGGPDMLAELGLVEPGRVCSFMDRYFAGASDNWLSAWLLLSAEAWLRAHRTSVDALARRSLS